MAQIVFKFEGGDADNNQINFYDASRFLYGASRFVYHLEYFRRTGNIAGNVRTKDIKFLLNAPEKGSFLFTILDQVQQSAVDNFIGVPMGAFFTWAWMKMAPGKSKSDQPTESALVDKYAQIALEEKEKRIKELQALNERRIEILAPYHSEFAKIPEAKANRLVNKIRPSAIDMGRPLLYGSIDKLSIQQKKQSLVILDKYSVDALKGNIVADLPTTLLGNIIQYNKESGWGKFRNAELGKVSFRVPTQIKPLWQNKILDSMKFKEELVLIFYIVTSPSGHLAHLIFKAVYSDGKKV